MTFDEAFETIPGDGWLSRPEAELLWRTAAACAGPVLEVGCYRGRSTCLLALLGRPVYCVDPFAGFDSADPSGLRAYQVFRGNVLERGFSLAVTGAGDNGQAYDGVTLWMQRIEDWVPRPCGFAYLDGDHTLIGTENQIEKALRCGAKVIAIHDVNDSGGGLAVRNAAIARLGLWRERVERLAVWEVES